MYVCSTSGLDSGGRPRLENCKKIADLIELLQAEMEHNKKSFKAAWNTQLNNQDNLREEKVMLHKLHNVFMVMLRKSGKQKVTRCDTNNILKEIGLDPSNNKNVDVQWIEFEKLLRVWTRPYSPPIDRTTNPLDPEYFDAMAALSAAANEANSQNMSQVEMERQRKKSRIGKILNAILICGGKEKGHFANTLEKEPEKETNQIEDEKAKFLAQFQPQFRESKSKNGFQNGKDIKNATKRQRQPSQLPNKQRRNTKREQSH